MEHIGIDVHEKTSQVCIGTESGDLIELRISTSHEALAKVFAERARSRIVIEASTESEWVARWLEELGHEVIVADPFFCADVLDAEPQSEDGPSGRTGVVRGVPARRVPTGAEAPRTKPDIGGRRSR